MTDALKVKRNRQKMVDLGASPQEIETYVSSTGYSAEEVKNAGRSGFLERVGESATKREAIAQDIKNVDQTKAEEIFQMAGKGGAGFINDIIGHGLVEAGRGIEAVSPEFVDEAVSKAAKAVVDSPAGEFIGNVAETVIENYGDFKVEHPRAARNIEAAGNILALPAIFKAGKSGVNVVRNSGSSTYSKIAERTKDIPDVVKQTASGAGDKTLGTTVRAAKGAKGAVEKGAGKIAATIKESDLPAQIKKMSPEERIIFQAIKAEGHNIDDALQMTKQAKEFGVDLPIFQALDSPTLRAYSKTLGEFGAGSKLARENVKMLREQQIPNAIKTMIDDIAKTGKSADENALIMKQFAEDIIAKSLEDLKAKAKPIYDSVVTADNLIPEEQFNQIKSMPVFQQAASSVLKKPTMQQYLDVNVLEDGTAAVSVPKNSMKFLDAVRKELGNMVDSVPMDPGKGKVDRAILTQTKNMLTGFMDEAYPDYAKARSIFSDDLKEVKALTDGPMGIISDLASGESRQAARKIFNLNPPQIRELRKAFLESNIEGSEQAWNAGVASYIDDLFERTRDGRNFRTVAFGDEIKRQRLAAAIPGKAAQLEKFFNVIDEAFKAGSMGGSDTATKQAAQAVLGAGAEGFRDAIMTATSPKTAALDFMRRAYAKTVLDDPDGAQKLARFLFTPEGEDFLKKASKLSK